MAKSKKKLASTASFVSRYFRECRISAGVTQIHLAKVLGCKPQFVANWERGACKPPLHMFPNIVTALKIPKSEVINALVKEEARQLNRLFQDSSAKP